MNEISDDGGRDSLSGPEALSAARAPRRPWVSPKVITSEVGPRTGVPHYFSPNDLVYPFGDFGPS